MNPYNGRVFDIGPDVMPQVAVGAPIPMDEFRSEVVALGTSATDEEREAALQPALVAIAPEVAQQLRLGGRELARRKERRKAAKRARKANR